MEDTEHTISAHPLPVKAPRKPRPSELAAKAAKLAGKSAPKSETTAKPPKKAPRTLRPASKPKAVKKAVKKSAAKTKKTVHLKSRRSGKDLRNHPAVRRPLVRTARLDIRATPAERAKVLAVAKRKGFTLTDVVMAGIAKLK